MKLKYSNCDKTKKNQTVMKLKNSYCEEKKTQNSKCDKDKKKLKLWQN